MKNINGSFDAENTIPMQKSTIEKKGYFIFFG